jgi:hypothetical protein
LCEDDNRNLPHVEVQQLSAVRIHLLHRDELGEMGPNNADIFRYLSSLPARQTVLKDAHEVFKAAITTQDCCWEEKFLRNIEFNNLGISEAHILDNTNHKEVRAYVAIMESTNEFRRLNSQPDFIYGWISPNI